MNHSNSLVVVGSLAYDDIETTTASHKNLLGGSATYFSISASYFVKPRVVGIVGRDFLAEDRALLLSKGVDLDGVVTDPTGDTFRWGGRYHTDMNERTTLYTALNVFEAFQPDLPASYRDCNVVFLGNIDPELQSDVVGQMTNPQFVTLDTMDFWIEGKRDQLLAALKRVDGIIINDEEGRLLTGEYTVLNVAKAVRALGPRTVVIKRGEHGAFLFHDDDVFFVPAYPLENVVDPTGAGDTFAGGFMGFLTQASSQSAENMRRAMVFGSVMASFCVEGFGVKRLQDLSRDDICSRYDRFVALTQCPEIVI